MEGNHLKENILKLLAKNPSGMKILSIAESLKISRHTISRYVFAMQEAGDIDCYELGRAKMCILKRGLKR